MRNPIRLKNFRFRFLPLYGIGVMILVFHPPSPLGFLLAAPPILLGLTLRSWGAGHLVKNDVLTTSGPYAHMRHPLYAGTILIATGFAVMVGGWVGVALVAVTWPWFALSYFPRKERIESARLEALYGEEYAAYRASVPALWPRWVGWRGSASSDLERSRVRAWALERYSDNNELGTLLAVVAAVTLMALRSGWGAAPWAG